MNFATTAEGFTVPERPRATRVSGRTERPISLYTGGTSELTHLPFVPGNKGPEVQNVSLLPDIISFAGDALAANAEMIGEAATGTADWASRNRYTIAGDIIAFLSFSWAGKLWRKVRQSFDNHSGY